MNYCSRHGQWYSHYCVYCGPAPIWSSNGTGVSHICEPGEFTTAGVQCRICGRDMTPRRQDYIMCDTPVAPI